MAKIEVDYITHSGDDLLVVNSARVSMDKESSYLYLLDDGRKISEEEYMGMDHLQYTEEVLKDGDVKLLTYLAKHNHWTPFSHPQITLRETVPIFVARQRFKHMVGFTYNEVSRRYVDSEPEFYVPDSWRARPEGSIKQGSGGEAPYSNHWKHSYSLHIADCKAVYQSMLDTGIAPEQARMVLPQSMMTSYYVTGSLAAFARLVKQRKDEHAQKEIQDLAKLIEGHIEPLFPVSWKALMV